MHSEYNGPRQEQGIVDYMLLQAAPGAKKVESAAELEAAAAKLYSGTSPEPLIALFAESADQVEGKKKSALAEAFLAAADSHRETYTFVWTADPAAAAAYGQAARSVAALLPAAYKSKEEAAAKPFPGKTTKEAISLWLQGGAALPLAGELSARSAPRYAASGKPLVRVAIPGLNFGSDAKGGNYWLNRLRKVAKAHPHFAFVAVPPTYPDLAEYGASGKEFSVTVDEFPYGKKYVMEGAWSPKDDAAPLASFLGAIKDGKAEAYVKSEPVPAGPDNGVTVAVGRNFEQVVLDDSKDGARPAGRARNPFGARRHGRSTEARILEPPLPPPRPARSAD